MHCLPGTIGSAAAQVNLTIPGYTSDSIVPTGVTVLANNTWCKAMRLRHGL